MNYLGPISLIIVGICFIAFSRALGKFYVFTNLLMESTDESRKFARFGVILGGIIFFIIGCSMVLETLGFLPK